MFKKKKILSIVAGMLSIVMLSGIGLAYYFHVAEAKGDIKGFGSGLLTDHTLYAEQSSTATTHGNIIYNPRYSPQHGTNPTGSRVHGWKVIFHDGVVRKGYALCIEAGVGAGFVQFKADTSNGTRYTYKRTLSSDSSPQLKKVAAWLSWLEEVNEKELHQIDWVMQLGVWACMGQVSLDRDLDTGRVYHEFNDLYNSDPTNDAFRHQVEFYEYGPRDSNEVAQRLVTFHMHKIDKGSLSLKKEAQ